MAQVVPDPARLTVSMRITNDSDSPVSLVNPDLGNPPPDLNWQQSLETYRTALLLSFGYLTLSVRDDAGRELPREGSATWVTPIRKPDVFLGPGEALELTIPIGEFYRLEPGRSYDVQATYGEEERKVSARARLGASAA